MKLYWIILLGFVISIAGIVTAATNETCNSDDWSLTDTTFELDNNTKTIKGNLTNNSCTTNCKTYTISIEISDCVNSTTCYGQPVLEVDNVNCNSTNLTQEYVEACKAVKQVATEEEEDNLITNEYQQLGATGLYELTFCIDISDVNSDGDDRKQSK